MLGLLVVAIACLILAARDHSVSLRMASAALLGTVIAVALTHTRGLSGGGGSASGAVAPPSKKELRTWARTVWGKEWWKENKDERLDAAAVALGAAAGALGGSSAKRSLPAPGAMARPSKQLRSGNPRQQASAEPILTLSDNSDDDVFDDPSYASSPTENVWAPKEDSDDEYNDDGSWDDSDDEAKLHLYGPKRTGKVLHSTFTVSRRGEVVRKLKVKDPHGEVIELHTKNEIHRGHKPVLAGLVGESWDKLINVSPRLKDYRSNIPIGSTVTFAEYVGV